MSLAEVGEIQQSWLGFEPEGVCSVCGLLITFNTATFVFKQKTSACALALQQH